MGRKFGVKPDTREAINKLLDLERRMPPSRILENLEKQKVIDVPKVKDLYNYLKSYRKQTFFSQKILISPLTQIRFILV